MRTKVVALPPTYIRVTALRGVGADPQVLHGHQVLVLGLIESTQATALCDDLISELEEAGHHILEAPVQAVGVGLGHRRVADHVITGNESSVAVEIVAVPADCAERVAFAARADGQGEVIGAAVKVLKARVVQIDEAPGNVAEEEGLARFEGEPPVCIFAVAQLAMSTGERRVLEDRVVVASRAFAYVTQAKAVLIAMLNVGAVGFIAASIDVFQVGGHEEAANLMRFNVRPAFGQLIHVGSTV